MAKQDISCILDNCANQNLHTALALGSFSINQTSLKIELRTELTRRGHVWSSGL